MFHTSSCSVSTMWWSPRWGKYLGCLPATGKFTQNILQEAIVEGCFYIRLSADHLFPKLLCFTCHLWRSSLIPHFPLSLQSTDNSHPSSVLPFLGNPAWLLQLMAFKNSVRLMMTNISWGLTMCQDCSLSLFCHLILTMPCRYYHYPHFCK